MNKLDNAMSIACGKSYLGIELGSTRIKAILINRQHQVLATGSSTWENRLQDGYWVYDMEQVWSGLQAAYADLKRNVGEVYDCQLTKVKSMGISAMMHGYIALDKDDNMLAPFRTWRNTHAKEAAAQLTALFGFNIPVRWSIASLYQTMLDGEAHVDEICHLTTLAGYIHQRLSGERILGVGDASGIFPIDETTKTYHQVMVEKFDALAEKHPWTLLEILPKVLPAGQMAGKLTKEGAKLLDISGELESDIPMAPPEGDAGTGMVATNTIAPHTGSLSAGTSVFGMVVLEQSMTQIHTEIDLAVTPDGAPFAMVHGNNCTNEINAWANVFKEFLESMGQTPDMGAIFTAMFQGATTGAADAGGLVLYNFLAGEPVVNLDTGCPMLVRAADDVLNFPNFMRAQLYSAIASLRLGMEILWSENVKVDSMYCHGGYFKTPEVGQKIVAAALNCDMKTMETAGEGGAWGMALLAAFMMEHQGKTLPQYLSELVFTDQSITTVHPDPDEVEGFHRYMERYRQGLPAEQRATECL